MRNSSFPGGASNVSACGAEPPTGAAPADAATLPAGLYTAQITSTDNGSGVALAEAYDGNFSDSSTKFTNLSTRARTTSTQAVIAGFVISGTGAQRILLRAVGPGLRPFGVPAALDRPTLGLFDKDGRLLASNEGWTAGGLKADLTVAMNRVGAFPLAEGSTDCAMFIALPVGAYTAVISGAAGSDGEVLVEVYDLP